MKIRKPILNPTRRVLGGWLTRTVFILMAVGLVALGVAQFIAHQKAGASTEQPGAGKYWRAERGPLTISVLASGSVKAKNTTNVICQVPGEVKITWVIDEGKVVKKGDKVLELEAAGLAENTLKQQVRVESVRAEYEGSVQDLEIQQSKARSDEMSAQNVLEIANLDHDKFIKGDYPQKLREKDSAITVAAAELERAKTRVEGTQRLLAKGYVSAGELDADKLTLLKEELDLKKAEHDKKVMEEYEYKRSLTKLEKDAREAEETLDRTRRSNKNLLRNKEIAVQTAKVKLELEEKQLADLQQHLTNCVLYAPQDGMVVYANETVRNSGGTKIEPGTQVRNQQRLLDLPDFSAWQVDTRVHESMVQQIRLGQQSLITLDAFPNVTLRASVAKIGVLPDSSRWYMPDTKEYLIDLDLTTTTLPLKPGMSAKSEILLDSLKDVISVPIQTVGTSGGKTVVWVKGETGPVKREVEVGPNNDRFVAVLKGMDEGEMVLMSPPRDDAQMGIDQRPSEKASDPIAKKKAQDKPADAPTTATLEPSMTPVEIELPNIQKIDAETTASK